MADFDFSQLTSDHIFMHFDPGKESWAGMFHGKPELGEALKKAVEEVVASLEGLSSEDSVRLQSILRNDRLLWDWVVDWWYCKEAVERIEPIKERFSKLTPILVRLTGSQEVNVYLREATQCYLYGLFQASTALFRTALETGLRESFDRKMGPVPGAKLYQMIADAEQQGLVSAHISSMADDVRKAANEVIHKTPITEQQEFDVLVKTRCVLEEFYKS
jgi:Domain of unknown function (DUF4145)